MRKDKNMECPICKSNDTRVQADFKELYECTLCGSEWHKDGDILLNAKEIK